MTPERPVVVLGDIHGNANTLIKLLSVIKEQFGKADLYSTGDLIDRGVHSKDVIDLCIKYRVKAVLGNHEMWLHRYLTTGHLHPFIFHRTMQAQYTLFSYGLHPKSVEDAEEKLRYMIPEAHQKFILGLPVWREIQTRGRIYRLSHAGLKRTAALKLLPAAKMLAQQEGSVSDALCGLVERGRPSLVIWSKNSFEQPDVWGFTDGSIQVFGHSPTPASKPVVERKWIAIPTGLGELGGSRIVAYNLTTGDSITATEMSAHIPPGKGTAEFTF